MPELLVLAFLYIKMHQFYELKTLSYNFNKFYTNIIYELLRN
jgi:hypothetical protein